VKALAESWLSTLAPRESGRVIITADHGLHETGHPDRLGDHGIFCGEDMLVPYILIGGGL
jgi:hypothetical protein